MNLFRKIAAFFYYDEKLAKDIPVLTILIFFPASIVSSILVIPLTIIALPFSLFGRKISNFIMKILLYIQHSISVSALYLILEYYFNDFNINDIIFGSILAFFGFFRSIRAMVNETMEKFS
tara:strand:- start:45 stop:407 length:363 start_codon:yes stop_codon:yes gene_type:complete